MLFGNFLLAKTQQRFIALKVSLQLSVAQQISLLKKKLFHMHRPNPRGKNWKTYMNTAEV